ncbi:MAG TPA: anti-sigma factor RsbA family regulatory protein [Pseudonocardiaceae bacterium]|nr:anti-sigma factor RsbA family regulatory protein [Pseudonocardiaceae bacterium]
MGGSRSADEFVHPAFLYRGPAEYLQGTVPFIRDGLAAGEPVAVAVPGPNLRLLLTELGTDAGRVRLLDMIRAARNPGRVVPSVLCGFADTHHGARVRIISEPLWAGRAATEYPACAHHEALINIAFAGRAVTILCPYDAERLGRRTLADAQACHPLLIDVNGERASTSYAPERIVADYDPPSPPAAAPSITFDTTSQVLVRRFTVVQASRLGLDGDHAELKLIVDELTANSLARGGGIGTLCFWAVRGYLVCEVRDAGHTVGRLTDCSSADGRGLLLVNYLADLVQQRTTPQGTTTRVYLKLSAEREPSGDSGDVIPAAPRTRRAPGRPTPLPWQTYEALHAAERFGRYLPQDVAVSTERPTALADKRLAAVADKRPTAVTDKRPAAVTDKRPAAVSAERPPAVSVESPQDWCSVEPVLEALTAVETLARVVDRWRARLVRLARTRGAPWTEIGHSLGVSKQAAHERYGRAHRRRVGRQPRDHADPLPPVQGM